MDVDVSKASLLNALNQKYGDNTEQKIATLNRLKKRVEMGLEKLVDFQAVAMTEVLADLVLNQKTKEII